MQKALENSLIYRIFAVVGAWFGRQWSESRVINCFLSPSIRGESSSANSIFARAWIALHGGLCFVFEKLRLNKLLRGSIFTKPFIWSSASLALAPLLPTMAVLALVLVSLVSLALTFGCDRSRRLSYSSVNKYILIYAFVYVVSIFMSVTVSGSLKGGAMTAVFVVFAIALQNSVTTRRQLDALIFLFVLSGSAVSAYGIYQYVFGVTAAPLWLDTEMFSDIKMRVFSTLGNPNVLAEYLLLVTPFALACILITKKTAAKLFFTGCLGALLLCMLLTYARGGWLGLVAAAAVFLVMLDRRFIILGIAGLIALYFVLPESVLNRFLSIGDLSDGSTSYRLSIWLGTIAMLRDYWFTGIGPGSAAFNKIYPIYSYNTIAAPHSHNLYLQIICDSGVCGIVVFLLILFSYFRTLCAAVAREKEKHLKLLQIAAISSAVGFLVQSATDYSFYNYRVTLVFWATLGLGAVIARAAELD